MGLRGQSNPILPSDENNCPSAKELDDSKTHVAARMDEIDAPSSKHELGLVQRVILGIVLACPSFLNTVVAQMTVIVLPTIARDLQIPGGRVQWIVSSTSLASACTLLFWGRLADIWDRRRVFQIGMLLITISCLVTPFAPNEASLDIFRALAGLGGAAATPSSIGLIFATLPPGKSQVYAVSAFSGGFPLGNILGNVLGGVVTQYLSWKWTFWIVAILGACTTAAALIVIPPKNQSPESLPSNWSSRLALMDWLGLILAVTFLVFLLVSLSEGNTAEWRTPWILGLLCSSVAFLAIFIPWQIYLQNRGTLPPFIRPSLFSSQSFCAAQAIAFLFWISFNNFLIYATYLFQDYLHLTVIDTTLRFLPSGIAGLCAVLVSSQLLTRVNGTLIAIWGTTCVSLPCLLLAVPIPPTTTYWAWTFPAMILSTLGSDSLYPCLMLAAMKSVPDSDKAMGAAVFQTIGQVGRSIGLAVATAIQIAVTRSEGQEVDMPDRALAGYRAADWFSFGVGVCAIFVVLVGFRGVGYVGRETPKLSPDSNEKCASPETDSATYVACQLPAKQDDAESRLD